jgi:carbon-monoxide dehydrogenase medium subunit
VNSVPICETCRHVARRSASGRAGANVDPEHRLKLPVLDYASPRSVAEAVQLLARHDGEAKVISGGQSLMPMLAFRLASPKLLIDLRHVPELDRIAIDDNGVELGAKVRWRDIETDRRLDTTHPLLVAAIKHVAHYQIRNRGTVGGSIAHADPAAEMPAIAVTCDAEIVVVGPAGRRSIPAVEFFVGPLLTMLTPSEIVVAVRLPPWPRQRRYGFEEFARRQGDFALAGVAVFYDQDADGRIRNSHIGAFGVGDTPLRLSAAEQTLEGEKPNATAFAPVVQAGMAGVTPQGDIHADARYRRALLGTLLDRALQRANERIYS